MRRLVLAVLAASATLVSFHAEAGGCGYPVAGYVTPPCGPVAPVVKVYPQPAPATVACEVRDLVNQGQFYSTEPLVTRRFCNATCPLPPEPGPVIPTCWR